jgi:hypothetical protein
LAFSCKYRLKDPAPPPLGPALPQTLVIGVTGNQKQHGSRLGENRLLRVDIGIVDPVNIQLSESFIVR